MNSRKSKFFIETDMFSELCTKIHDVPEIKKHIKYDKAEVFADLSEEELKTIMCDSSEPTDDGSKRHAFIKALYDCVQRVDGPKSAKDFFQKARENPAYYFIEEPNSIIFTTKPKPERESIMDGYGIWMIGGDDLNDTFLESYGEDFPPYTKFGIDRDGWENIREAVGRFPSSSMIIFDNFITVADKKTRELYGLSNIKSIIDNFVSNKLVIDSYNILIVSKLKPLREEAYYRNKDLTIRKNIIRNICIWIRHIKQTFPKIKVQFILSSHTPEHDRYIFFNYGIFTSGKGYRIFEPGSNVVYCDENTEDTEEEETKDYHFDAIKYISDHSTKGTDKFNRAHKIQAKIWNLYDKSWKNEDGRTKVIDYKTNVIDNIDYHTIIIGDKFKDFSIRRE